MTQNLDKAQQHNAELNMQIHERAAKISDMQKFFNQQFMQIGGGERTRIAESWQISTESKNLNQTVAT